MGDTRWRSNLKGKAGTETISNFASISGTAIAGAVTGDVTGDVTGTCTGKVITANSYFKIGTKQYIFAGGLNSEASIVAVATAISASVKGSVYMSSAGTLWIFDTDTAATKATTA